MESTFFRSNVKPALKWAIYNPNPYADQHKYWFVTSLGTFPDQAKVLRWAGKTEWHASGFGSSYWFSAFWGFLSNEKSVVKTEAGVVSARSLLPVACVTNGYATADLNCLMALMASLTGASSLWLFACFTSTWSSSRQDSPSRRRLGRYSRRRRIRRVPAQCARAAGTAQAAQEQKKRAGEGSSGVFLIITRNVPHETREPTPGSTPHRHRPNANGNRKVSRLGGGGDGRSARPDRQRQRRSQGVTSSRRLRLSPLVRPTGRTLLSEPIDELTPLYPFFKF